MDANTQSLKHHFLIAMPQMGDPRFVHTITYLCEHDENGAMGIVINKPMDVTLGEIFDQLNIEPQDEIAAAQNILQGGPVQMDRGFVLHRATGEWESTIKIGPSVHLTTSCDILDAMANHRGPKDAVVALGYAGWSAEQLDYEIAQNAWLVVPADDALIFDAPFEQRYEAAARLIGIDVNLISTQVGHA